MYNSKARKHFFTSYLVFILIISGFSGFFIFNINPNTGIVSAAIITVDLYGGGDYSQPYYDTGYSSLYGSGAGQTVNYPARPSSGYTYQPSTGGSMDYGNQSFIQSDYFGN